MTKPTVSPWVMPVLNDKGQEVPDPRPVAVPLGYQAPEDLKDLVARLTRSSLDAAGMAEVETFDEADDFELDEDDGYDHSSPYEEGFDPEFHGMRAQEQAAGFAQGPSKKRAALLAKQAAEMDAKAKAMLDERQRRIAEDIAVDLAIERAREDRRSTRP